MVKQKANVNIVTRTTTQLRINSVRLGQVTFLISASTAMRKSAISGKFIIRYATQTTQAKIRAGMPIC